MLVQVSSAVVVAGMVALAFAGVKEKLDFHGCHEKGCQAPASWLLGIPLTVAWLFIGLFALSWIFLEVRSDGPTLSWRLTMFRRRAVRFVDVKEAGLTQSLSGTKFFVFQMLDGTEQRMLFLFGEGSLIHSKRARRWGERITKEAEFLRSKTTNGLAKSS